MTPALRCTVATLGLNLGRQAWSGFWLVALIAGALVAALVRALPRPEGPGQWWPVVILGELAVTGFYFAAVHVLLEHGEGTLVACYVFFQNNVKIYPSLQCSSDLLRTASNQTPSPRWLRLHLT